MRNQLGKNNNNISQQYKAYTLSERRYNTEPAANGRLLRTGMDGSVNENEKLLLKRAYCELLGHELTEHQRRATREKRAPLSFFPLKRLIHSLCCDAQCQWAFIGVPPI